MSRKKTIGFICSLLALALIVGVWAYYSATTAVNNELKTAKYGSELVEEFTPHKEWQPGEEVTKKAGVENTGDYDLFVRVKMSEAWTLAGGGTVTHLSSSTKFLTATATAAIQTNLTDGDTSGDDSVVYKKLAASGWTFNQADGYWYYNTKLAANASTGALLEAITLAGNTDMGQYTEVKYYTKMTSKPANTVIGTDPATGWVIYTGAVVPDGTTFTRSVSQIDSAHPGYAGASYVLTITCETLQATQEAFDAATAWSSTPATVKTAWGLNP